MNSGGAMALELSTSIAEPGAPCVAETCGDSAGRRRRPSAAERMRELEREVEALRKEVADRDRLIGVAAHELRGPLSSIQGLSGMLAEGAMGAVTPEQLEVVRTIRAAGQTSLELVNNLLDLTTIGEDRPLRVWPTDPAELAQKCIGLLAPEARRKGTGIMLSTAGPQGLADLDPAAMKQVIFNLLTNALKFSPRRSIVSVAVEVTANECVVCVRDQGPGIPDEERHRLFKIFGQLSARPTGDEKSTGIGLAVCHRIVAAHRGIIEVRNLDEGGCEFRVSVPRSRAEDK